MGVDCKTFDVVVGVIDRVDERVSFIPFVGMLVGSCFKETVASEWTTVSSEWSNEW